MVVLKKRMKGTKGRPDKRRVVFSTNVAETSLTIDGVTVVVDAGFTKESLYDHQKRMKILQVLHPWSVVASADCTGSWGSHDSSSERTEASWGCLTCLSGSSWPFPHRPVCT
jgi:hypothetical protein